VEFVRGQDKNAFLGDRLHGDSLQADSRNTRFNNESQSI
jgi:hypothetical protein